MASRRQDLIGVYSDSTLASGAFNDDNENYIRFDTFARLILEEVSDYRLSEAEAVYTSLKLKSNP